MGKYLVVVVVVCNMHDVDGGGDRYLYIGDLN